MIIATASGKGGTGRTTLATLGSESLLVEDSNGRAAKAVYKTWSNLCSTM